MQTYPSLADLPGAPDIVDVFRRESELPGVAREAVAAGAGTLWMQLGLHSDEAVQIAHDAGLEVVSNRCVKIEHARFARRPAPPGLRHRRHLVAQEPGLTSSVRLFDADTPLVLESGATLAPVDVAYATYGTLDADAGNAVLICHALTGDADAADWWSTLVGPGRAVDTDRFYVVCANLLGGCQGTTGPSSIDPGDGRAVRPGLPAVHRPGPQHGAPRAAAHARRAAAARGGRRIARRDAGAAVGARRAGGDRARGGHLRQRAAERAEHRLLHRRPRGDPARPRVRRGRAERALGRADDGPHHLPLRGGDAAQVRPRATRPGAHDAGLGLRGRALPRPPGRDLPRPLRPAHLHLPLARRWTTSSRSRSRSLARRPPTSCSSPSTPTGASAASTPGTSPPSCARCGAEPRHVEIASPWGHDSFLMDVPAYHEAVAGLLSG